MYQWKRVLIAVVGGAVLGVLCIIGVGTRLGYSGNGILLSAIWFNRVVMGLVIGLAPFIKIKENLPTAAVRGLILGLIISGSLLLATDFIDIPGFFAGIAYGVIIDLAATKLAPMPKNKNQ